MKKFRAVSFNSKNFFVSNGSISYRVNYYPQKNDLIIITMNHSNNDILGVRSVFAEGNDFVYFSEILDICNFLNLANKLGVHIGNNELRYLYNSVKNMFDSLKD